MLLNEVMGIVYQVMGVASRSLRRATAVPKSDSVSLRFKRNKNRTVLKRLKASLLLSCFTSANKDGWMVD